MLDSRQFIASGMFLMILGGWFDWLPVKWCAQWFSIWLEFSCIKVEFYIKEVDNFLVCFNGDF